MRRKWLALSEDRICSDEDCYDLVEEFYSSQPPSRPTTTEETPYGGRPKGGGGYMAGDIPTNTTVQSTSKKDKWKRKAVARLPATTEDVTVSRECAYDSLHTMTDARMDFIQGCETSGDAGPRAA